MKPQQVITPGRLLPVALAAVPAVIAAAVSVKYLSPAKPLWLIALAAVPLVELAAVFRRSGAVKFPSTGAVRFLPVTLRLRMMPLLRVLRVFALTLLAVALSCPREGMEEVRVETEGVDIVVCLDVSGSMKSQDLARGRSRLDVAKEVAEWFVDQREDDRMALVLFARLAFRQCPLTTDHDVLKDFLKGVEIGVIDEERTAIGSAIGTSVNALKQSKAKSKVVVLLTDGQNNSGKIDPSTAAEIAARFGVKVYTVGVGREQGVKVFGRAVSRKDLIDEDTLKEIAERTGARYYRARDREQLLDIHKKIAELEKTKRETIRYTRFEARFRGLLSAALALLLVETLLGATWLRRSP